MHYTTVTPTIANHELTKPSHPKLAALVIVATVMLIRNYVLENFPVSGLVGCVQNIVYCSPNGP